MFLFHTGAIKSYNLCLCMCFKNILFLFHTGAIKRFVSERNCEHPFFQRFYSTLVRLKDAVVVAEEAQKTGFYSTLVRLKVKGYRLQQTWKCEFLFHTGAIKSISKSFFVSDWMFSFLFHTGAIKSFGFKVKASIICISFLFHTGAIKSVVPPIKKQVNSEKFLFHTGAIKSNQRRLKHLRLFSFYSTLVRLKASTSITQTPSSTSVSIPHWCD